LFLDGMSFFDMPSIFELGQAIHIHGPSQPTQKEQAYVRQRHNQNAVGHHARNLQVHGQGTYKQRAPGYPTYNELTQKVSNDQSERHVASGIHHYEEPRRTGCSFSPSEVAPNGLAGLSRRKTLGPMPAGCGTLAVPQVDLSDIPPVADFFASPASVPNNIRDDFTPIVAHRAPPTFQDVSNHMMKAYGPATAAPPVRPTLSNESHTFHPQERQHYPARCLHTMQQQQSYGVPTSHFPNKQHQHYSGVHTSASPNVAKAAASIGFHDPPLIAFEPTNHGPAGYPRVTTPTMTMMKPLEVDELRDSPPPVDAMDRAVQNLVNLQDLREIRATPEQLKVKKQKELFRMTEHKSRPKAPAANIYHAGINAALADIQKHKQPVAPPSKDIMKNHAFHPAAPRAGMLVVYGEPQPQQAIAVSGSIPLPGVNVLARDSHGQSHRVGDNY
jgi:hypothetical protein